MRRKSDYSLYRHITFLMRDAINFNNSYTKVMKILLSLLFVIPILSFSSEQKLEKFLDLPVSEKNSFKHALELELNLFGGDEGCFDKLIFVRNASKENSKGEIENTYHLNFFDGRYERTIFRLSNIDLNDVHYHEDPPSGARHGTKKYRYIKIKKDLLKYRLKSQRMKQFGFVNHTYYPAKWVKIELAKKDDVYHLKHIVNHQGNHLEVEMQCKYRL